MSPFEAEFDIHWNMLNNIQEKLTLSPEHMQAGTKHNISDGDGK